MFARTERLLLRPGWIEDAPALAAAICPDFGMLDQCSGRWPSVPEQAEQWLRHRQEPPLPSLLVLSRTSDAPRIVGRTALHCTKEGTAELDFWISPHHRGRGFATEAARAMLAIAQALGLRWLAACAINEDRAAGRVLEKLGFLPSIVMASQPGIRSASAHVTRYRRVIDRNTSQRMPLLAA